MKTVLKGKLVSIDSRLNFFHFLRALPLNNPRSESSCFPILGNCTAWSMEFTLMVLYLRMILWVLQTTALIHSSVRQVDYILWGFTLDKETGNCLKEWIKLAALFEV